MTPTLDTALADLPAKPRVHELSKRIGISNKELIAALAERGLTITSASASVPRSVAEELISALLGGGSKADTGTGAVDPPSAGTLTGEPKPVETPADDHQQAPPPMDLGPPINPLFLPPVDVAPVRPARRRKAAPVSDADVPEAEPAPEQTPSDTESDTDTDADTAPTIGRRRRGRSGKGRRAASDGTEGGNDSDPTHPDRTDSDRSDAQVADAGRQSGTDQMVGTDASADTDTDSGNDVGTVPADDSDDDSSARGRRRRRGRRGRGRITDADDQQADTAADGTDDTSDRATAEVGVLDRGRDDAGSSSATAADSGAASDPDNDTTEEVDADSDGGAGSGNRRRRRRRRRANGDEVPREDDPDNTVVHVREPRLSQAATAGTGSGSGEVQGVRGSTRLEAKRQRRRDSRDSSRRRPQILTEAEFLARRESVERVMAVRQRGGLVQVALLEDRVLVEHFVSQTGSDSMIGSVFLGKVQNVLPSMEAAFVDIGRGRNAVIYAGEVNWDAAGLGGKARRIETALTSGNTILAQVSKDPVGHKGARLTTQISLPGRFVVYVPGSGATGISRKLPDTERKRLKSIMDRIVPDDAGVIIRTAAEGIAEEELARDVERLKSQWEEITRRASEKTSAPTQLYAEPGTLIKVIRDLFNSDITRLVVDGDDAYEPVAEYITSVAPELADRLVRYESASPNGPDVFATYRVDEQIAKALERKVHLPSGGSLVIDRTEAMTVVDVNTGKYTGSGGNLEETVTKNNLEAAEEIVRQLRLRDIGGIIVVDFIDMVLETNRELVLRRLTEALGRDRTRHQVAEVTSLGLVQMTRKRMGTGLVEAFSEPCPHCGGRGIVLHDLPMVAAPVEDNSSERRAGKARRSRGREERTEDIVVPRVVEQTPGRRPDPRGPKPPTASGGGRNSAPTDSAATGRGASTDQASAHGVEKTHVDRTVSDGDDVDWIEAAASAGIAAADAADADDFEFGEPAMDSAIEPVAEPAAERTGPNEVVAGTDEVLADPGTSSTGGPPAESAAGTSNQAGTAGAAANGSVAPGEIEPGQAAEPRRRRSGRRAAGRPAGSPQGASGPVDIIVPEPMTTISRTDSSAINPPGLTTSGTGEQAASSGVSATDQDQGAVAFDGQDEHAEETSSGARTSAAEPAAPRRRRAASRPAGPAAGNGGEALVLTVPADRFNQ